MHRPMMAQRTCLLLGLLGLLALVYIAAAAGAPRVHVGVKVAAGSKDLPLRVLINVL
jgi:hypothetical protein